MYFFMCWGKKDANARVTQPGLGYLNYSFNIKLHKTAKWEIVPFVIVSIGENGGEETDQDHNIYTLRDLRHVETRYCRNVNKTSYSTPQSFPFKEKKIRSHTFLSISTNCT